MASLWNKPESKFESSAKVVDGSLILSLPDAINPIVWRMELGNVKASAIEVRAATDDSGHHILTLKTPKGDVHDIAPFAVKETAVNALMNISRAMHEAEGKMAAAANPAITAPVMSASLHDTRRKKSGWKWLAIGISIIFIIWFLTTRITVPPSDEVVSGSYPPPSSGAPAASGNGDSGVPLSADDYLRGL